MKRNKLVKILGISLLGVTALSSISPIAAHAAWKQNNTGWWYTEGNSWATSWRKIDGVWYYFDNSGYMKTGWVKDNGVWYYLDNSGAMKTGWVKDNGVWYYLDSSGAMKTGWVKDNGLWYFLNGSGAMQTGWLKESGEWYYLNGSGEMKIGWLLDNGTWYFLADSGAMKTGLLEYQGDKYFLNETGAMEKGWLTIDNNKYYFTETGRQAFGKVNADGETYYFNSNDGTLVKNFESKYVITDNEGKITKFDVEAAKKDILANDSEYLNKCKESEDIDDIYFMEPDLDITTDLLNGQLADYNIEEEECLSVCAMKVCDNVERMHSVYLIGLKSGKIYSADSHGNSEVYEIKDNKKVATYVNTKTNYVGNWR